jgi:hypothetical protein
MNDLKQSSPPSAPVEIFTDPGPDADHARLVTGLADAIAALFTDPLFTEQFLATLAAGDQTDPEDPTLSGPVTP